MFGNTLKFMLVVLEGKWKSQDEYGPPAAQILVENGGRCIRQLVPGCLLVEWIYLRRDFFSSWRFPLLTCATSKEGSRWFSGDELADLSLSCKSWICLAGLRCEPKNLEEVSISDCCCVSKTLKSSLVKEILLIIITILFHFYSLCYSKIIWWISVLSIKCN